MADNQYIDYTTDSGVVESVNLEAGTVKVRLAADRDCGGCPAKTLCHAGSPESSLVDVTTPHAKRFRKGDRVTLRGTERLHRKAIMLATVLPCIALIAVMVLIYVCTANQVAAALGGLGSMLFFFALLYIMRDKIAHEFIFEIMPEQP